MASLTGNKIKDTYSGLIKTVDNGVVGGTEKQLTDGEGNALPITAGTSGISFTGNADFSSATVTGLPSGSAGLESGTGTDSMQSAASLTTVAADAAGSCSIALGDGATATGQEDVIIGKGAASEASNKGGTALGSGTCVDDGAVALGRCAQATGIQAIAIGGNCNLFGGNGPIASATNSITIGAGSSSTASGSVALGRSVVASKADTVTVKELETCVAGGGIYLTTPDGLAQPKLTVDNSCALLVDGSPIGGGGAAGLESGTGTDSMQSAASLTTVGANAAQPDSIALGDGAQTPGTLGAGGVAIGANSCVGNYDGTAVGCGATVDSNGQAFGALSRVTGNQGVALGFNACANAAATALGHEPVATGDLSVAVGKACATGACNVNIGYNSRDQLFGAGTCATAIGPNTYTSGNGAIAIGASGSSTGAYAACAIAIGQRTEVGGACAIGIGYRADTASTHAISIGVQAGGNADCAIGIGSGANANTAGSIAIGQSANNSGANSIAIGTSATVGAGDDSEVVIGHNATGGNDYAVTIGGNACSLSGTNRYQVTIGYGAGITDHCGISLGANSSSTAAEAAAIGAGVVAAKACTVTVKELETCVAGGGITMKSPDTTEYKLTVANGGELLVDGNSLTTKLSNTTTGTVSTFDTDDFPISLAIPANTFAPGDIIRIKSLAQQTGAGSSYVNINVHTVQDANGGSPIATVNGASPAKALNFEKTIKVDTSTSTVWFDANQAHDGYTSGNGGGQSSIEFNDVSVDWTVDQYLNVVTYVPTGNTMKVYYLSAEKVN
jgi:hypothetical protein